MSARFFACVSCIAITAIASDATPQTAPVPSNSIHVSMDRLRHSERYQSPNLRKRVDANCTNLPVREYLSNLAEQSGVAIFLDERPLAKTQAAFDKRWSIQIDQQIMLESALALALEPNGLAHYIKNGKIVVTNESFVVWPK